MSHPVISERTCVIDGTCSFHSEIVGAFLKKRHLAETRQSIQKLKIDEDRHRGIGQNLSQRSS